MNTTNSGTINIPGAKGANDRQVLYQLTTAEEADEKKGLNGGKILDLTLTEDDEVIYRFENGEATECANKDAEIALCIMMYSYN